MILGELTTSLLHVPFPSHQDLADLVLTTYLYRINCRLPQTPRTPSTAAAHYFDDTFSRGNFRRKSSTAGPKSPGTAGGRLRRSSTSRSIGNHSLYSPSDAGTNPHHLDGGMSSAGSRRDSTAVSDGGDAFGKEQELKREREGQEKENERRRSEADSHVEKYIGEQLNRIRTDEDSVAVYEDEFEAQLD
jgi:hypothetical protein